MHKSLQRKVALATFMTLGLQANSHAADSASVEFASGNKTQMLRIGTQWMWNQQWWQSNDTHIGGYWDLNLAQWRGQNYKGSADAHQNLVSVGITPVFRFQHDSKIGFYTEVGIGLHLLSDTYDNNGRILSGNVQFGDHIGLGYVFKNNLDISFKFQHFSNGGIKQPNGGINFAVLKIGHTF
jgi:hypothetical protein